MAPVAATFADGMTNDEIRREHPDLKLGGTFEVRHYAVLAGQERELPLHRPA